MELIINCFALALKPGFIIQFLSWTLVENNQQL